MRLYANKIKFILLLLLAMVLPVTIHCKWSLFPDLISGAPIDGSAASPQLAADCEGNVTAVWFQDDGTGTFRIYANRYTAGAWGVQTLISNDTEATGSAAGALLQLTVDCTGNVTAVWFQDDGTGTFRIYANRYTAGAWGVQTLISNDTGVTGSAAGDLLQLTVDCTGNVTAVWRQDDGTGTLRIYANRYTAGAWGDQTLISNNTGVTGTAGNPQLTVDCTGNVTAVWFQDDGTGTLRIYANRYTAGTWGVQTLISNDTEATGSAAGAIPQLTVDCTGNVTAVWFQDDGTGTFRIYANRYTAGAWGVQTLISNDTGVTGSAAGDLLQLTVDCTGNVTAVWRQDDGTGTLRIYANRYTAGAWGDQTLISNNTGVTGTAGNPQLTVDCTGNVTAVWFQDDGTGTLRIYANRYTAGTWGVQTLISNDTEVTGTAGNPQLTVDCTGNVTAVWFQDDGTGTFRIYANRYTAGAWGVQTLISNDTGVTGSAAGDLLQHVTIDCTGNVTAVWQQDDGTGTFRIYANRYTAGAWGVQTLISNNTGVTGTAGNPKLTVDCTGNVTAVWQQVDGTGTIRIYAARGIFPPAPAVFSGCQTLLRFPAQADLVNIVRWNPVPYTSQIVKYKIYCAPYKKQTPCCADCFSCLIRCCTCPCINSQLIGEVSAAEPLVFCHHNRCCGQQVTYCVKAVDTNGDETPVPASVTVPKVS